MELKILKESQNPLFNRKEVFASVKSNASPTNDEILTSLSEKYSVEKNAIRIKNIKGKFGTNEFAIIANIYPSNEERDKVEKLTKKEKEIENKASEEAAKPVEEKSAEEPVPAVEETGMNPVQEAKEVETKKAEEDKKEKDKTPEEKQAE